MALEIKLNQKLTQTLAMTPQLRQAIELLQLGRQEYVDVIAEELLKNPVLEEVGEDGGDDSAPQGANASQGASESRPAGADSGPETQPSPRERETSATQKQQSDAEGQSSGENDEWSGDNDYFDGNLYGSYEYPRGGGRISSSDERPSIEATISYPEGLSSHLLWQLRTMELKEVDQNIAGQIVGNLNRDGYLCSSVDEIAEACERPAEDVERVLRFIQTLDPAGVGARDLRECLLVQLDQQGLGDSLSAQIVSGHLNDLELRRYDVIARKLDVTVDEIYEAIRLIQRLEPRPGRPFVEESPVYITPDVYVRRVGNDYVISLNDTGVPRLRLNPDYKRLLAVAQKSDRQSREYLVDQVRAGAGLIKSIHRRQQTIFRVTESIMNFQREFLEEGVSALKPLVLRDVAEDVSMHESTISRVTTNKYVHTPQGVFELKFFFSSGLRGDTGEVSSESVKQRIRDLIGHENPKRPLSDQNIVNTLKGEGIDIARRTVAKYRESLGILSSSRRKKVF